jgi:hypothetical protein
VTTSAAKVPVMSLPRNVPHFSVARCRLIYDWGGLTMRSRLLSLVRSMPADEAALLAGVGQRLQSTFKRLEQRAAVQKGPCLATAHRAFAMFVQDLRPHGSGVFRRAVFARRGSGGSATALTFGTAGSSTPRARRTADRRRPLDAHGRIAPAPAARASPATRASRGRPTAYPLQRGTSWRRWVRLTRRSAH